MSDSVGPHRQQPARLPRPWDSPGKSAGVGCHFLLQCIKVKSLSHVRLLATPWIVAHQAHPSMGFSRQEFWGVVPLPSPRSTVNTFLQTSRSTLCVHQKRSQVFRRPILIIIMWLPRGYSGKESACNAGDTIDAGSIPGSERSPELGNGNWLQYSCLDGQRSQADTAHGVAKELDRTEHAHTF